MLSSITLKKSVALLLATSAMATLAQAKDQQVTITTDQLVPYYEQMSRGVIQPAVSEASFKSLSFLRFDEFPYSVQSVTPVQNTTLQDLFTTDVARFNQLQGTTTFAEGVRKFYSQLNFEPKFQVHDRPYYYMADWGELFHPPIKSLELPQSMYWDGFPEQDSSKLESEYFTPAFQESIDAQTGTEMTYGNKLTLYSNGTSFAQKLRLVRSAKHHIFMAVLGFICDKSSEELLHAMEERAHAGVDVYVIIDGMFNDTFSRGCVMKMRHNGIKVTAVRDIFRKDSYWTVMHQKFWVRDGEEMIIGGENIINYENNSDGFNDMNRDADVLVTGPAVADAEVAFTHKWLARAKKKHREDVRPYLEKALSTIEDQRVHGLRGKQNYAGWLSNPETRMNGVCRALFQDKMADSQPIEPALEAYARAAKVQIFATTPDVGMYDSQYKKLHRDVRYLDRFHQALESNTTAKTTIITNGFGGGNGEMSEWLKDHVFKAREKGWKEIAKLLNDYQVSNSRTLSKENRDVMMKMHAANPSMQIWTYIQYMHAKQYLFDRIATFFGSWNMDQNSADFAHEAGIICLDESIRKQLEPQLVKDISNSVPLVSKNGQ